MNVALCSTPIMDELGVAIFSMPSKTPFDRFSRCAIIALYTIESSKDHDQEEYAA